MSTQESMVNTERVLSGFASLLSSALTVDNDNGVQPLDSSSRTLQQLLSRSVRDDDVCCMVPSLLMRQPDGHQSSHDGSNLKDQAALNLARNLALTRRELVFGPMALLKNISKTLNELIDSRLRSSLNALLKKARTQVDPTLTRVLVGLMAASNDPISQSALVSSFRVLNGADVNAVGDVILPLVLETTIDLKIFNELVTITVVAPGTIQGSFGASDFGIIKAEVVLDTVTLLQGMMKEARDVVRKAISIASTLAARLLGPSMGCQNTGLPTNIVPTKSVNAFDDLMKIPSRPTLEEQQNVSFMPPPPRRPSRNTVGDLRKVLSSTEVVKTNKTNASWAVGSSSSSANVDAPAGLSLLAHALGLNKRSIQNEVDEGGRKRQKSNVEEGTRNNSQTSPQESNKEASPTLTKSSGS